MQYIFERGIIPITKEVEEDYLMRVGEVARFVIDNDIPIVEDIVYTTVQKIKNF